MERKGAEAAATSKSKGLLEQEKVMRESVCVSVEKERERVRGREREREGGREGGSD